MGEGPEKVIFDEPELQSGFFGRKYFSPPKKAPHFSNLQFKEQYDVRKAHVIINPYSGKKKGTTVGNFVRDELINSKIDVELYVTERPEHAIEIARDIDLNDGDTIVTVGGDGTFCEVISGFMSRTKEVSNIPLGLVPAGTGNSQANDMEIPI